MPEKNVSMTVFDEAARGNPEALNFFMDARKGNDPAFETRETLLGRSLLHELLINYVLLLEDKENKDKDWLQRLNPYHQAINTLLKANPGLVDSKDNQNFSPLQVMSMHCPEMRARCQDEDHRQAIALVLSDAKKCRSAEGGDMALSRLTGRLCSK